MFEAVKKSFYAHLLPSISEVQILLCAATVLSMISDKRISCIGLLLVYFVSLVFEL